MNTLSIPHIICMGVASSGKTSIGKKIAIHLQRTFIEGDTLHSKDNRHKMQQGIALQDEDRQQWLEKICNCIKETENKKQRVVISCSALKKKYRDHLRKSYCPLYFLCFYTSYEIIAQRMQKRRGHFMPISLLKSQYDNLELPYNEKDCSIISVNKDILDVFVQSILCINKI